MPSVGGLIPAIVLAAGKGSRLGGGKLLLDFRGQPLLHWLLKALLAAQGVGEIIVVTGYCADEVTASCKSLSPTIRCVFNPDYAQGRSTSVKAGLRALTPGTAAVMITPGDVPLITTNLVGALLLEYERTGRIVFPRVQGRKGHPVVFPAAAFRHLDRLTGEETLHDYLLSHLDECAPVDWDDAGCLADIDTPDDLNSRDLPNARPGTQ